MDGGSGSESGFARDNDASEAGDGMVGGRYASNVRILLRTALLFLEKLTLEPAQIGPADIAILRSAGPMLRFGFDYD